MEPAQHALVIRIGERDVDARAAMPLDAPRHEAEQQSRQHHDDGHRRREQMQPVRGVRGRGDRARAHGVQLVDRRDRNAGDERARRERDREDAMHGRRIEERAFPGDAVLEREAAQIESGHDAARQRRCRPVQQACGARVVDRCGALAPVADEARDRRAERSLRLAPRQPVDAAGDAGDSAPQRPGGEIMRAGRAQQPGSPAAARRRRGSRRARPAPAARAG